MKKMILLMIASLFVVGATGNLFAWGVSEKDYQVTQSGVTSVEARKSIKVKRNSKGNTLEQQNIIDSYKVENEPGAIKYLYVISNFTGKIIRYSTVKGKVTDNAKGLTPSRVTATSNKGSAQADRGLKSRIHGKLKYTDQVMQESGTFGTSSPYIYWFDTKGVYNKLWMNTSATVTLSNQPLPISASGELVIKLK